MSKTNRPTRFALTTAGLSAPKRADVKAGHGYYFGASSSPSFALVLSVSDDVVVHADSYSLSVTRTPRWIFEDLVARAAQTVIDDFNRAAEACNAINKRGGPKTTMEQFAFQLARRLDARHESNGAPVSFADHDRVRFSVTCDGDAYGADQFGVLASFDSEKNVAIVETARSEESAFVDAGFRILSTETVKACPTADDWSVRSLLAQPTRAA
jgi:hypothetical protein